MPSPRWLFVPIMFALLAIEAMIVWRSFDVRATLYATSWRANRPAGELVDGFRVVQEIPAGLVRTRPPKKKSIHWHGPHSLKPLLEPNCFALRFATYGRSNSGRIQVTWQQGDASQSWLVAAKDLVDNDFVDFCPRDGIVMQQASLVAVQGVEGKPGTAATLWLTRSRLRPASVQGRNIGKLSLSLQMSYLHRASARDIAGVGKGAFLFACLCSLAIAGFALWRGLREFTGIGARRPRLS
jgi:hypothetical protein